MASGFIILGKGSSIQLMFLCFYLNFSEYVIRMFLQILVECILQIDLLSEPEYRYRY